MKMLISVKCTFLSDKIHANKGKTKKLYKIVSDLMGTHKENLLPKANLDRELAENFADFIIGKIHKIRDTLDQYKWFEHTPRQLILTKEIFTQLSKSAVKRLIIEMQSKMCELDMLPMKLIKENLDMFLDLLTKIVNISLENGIFA